MNKSNINVPSAGTTVDNDSTAQNHSVNQPNANTNVVGSLLGQLEIKFRAWHTGEKKWWFFDLFDLMCGHTDIIDNRYRLKYRTQYTGLKDKNGKEIYEGDILSVWYSRDTTGKDIVKFNHIVEWEETNGFSGWNIPFLETAEIIGNVFENPELLHSVA